jgi:hypothetical protein
MDADWTTWVSSDDLPIPATPVTSTGQRASSRSNKSESSPQRPAKRSGFVIRPRSVNGFSGIIVSAWGLRSMIAPAKIIA